MVAADARATCGIVGPLPPYDAVGAFAAAAQIGSQPRVGARTGVSIGNSARNAHVARLRSRDDPGLPSSAWPRDVAEHLGKFGTRVGSLGALSRAAAARKKHFWLQEKEAHAKVHSDSRGHVAATASRSNVWNGQLGCILWRNLDLDLMRFACPCPAKSSYEITRSVTSRLLHCDLPQLQNVENPRPGTRRTRA